MLGLDSCLAEFRALRTRRPSTDGPEQVRWESCSTCPTCDVLVPHTLCGARSVLCRAPKRAARARARPSPALVRAPPPIAHNLECRTVTCGSIIEGYRVKTGWVPPFIIACNDVCMSGIVWDRHQRWPASALGTALLMLEGAGGGAGGALGVALGPAPKRSSSLAGRPLSFRKIQRLQFWAGQGNGAAGCPAGSAAAGLAAGGGYAHKQLAKHRVGGQTVSRYERVHGYWYIVTGCGSGCDEGIVLLSSPPGPPEQRRRPQTSRSC